MIARQRERGYTLVELLVVGVMLISLAAVGIPALQQMLVRSKLQGSAREISIHFMSARMEAMRMGRSVVVTPMFNGSALQGFIDEDDDLVRDPGERLVFDLPIPPTGNVGVYFMGDDLVVGTALAPGESIDGLTPVSGGPLAAAVFEPDGSIRDQGAIRIADGRTPRSNIFEIRIEPSATAKVDVRKYVYGGPNGDDYYPQGGSTWEWY